jgi:hypothetical protein
MIPSYALQNHEYVYIILGKTGLKDMTLLLDMSILRLQK